MVCRELRNLDQQEAVFPVEALKSGADGSGMLEVSREAPLLDEFGAVLLQVLFFWKTLFEIDVVPFAPVITPQQTLKVESSG